MYTKVNCIVSIIISRIGDTWTFMHLLFLWNTPTNTSSQIDFNSKQLSPTWAYISPTHFTTLVVYTAPTFTALAPACSPVSCFLFRQVTLKFYASSKDHAIQRTTSAEVLFLAAAYAPFWCALAVGVTTLSRDKCAHALARKFERIHSLARSTKWMAMYNYTPARAPFVVEYYICGYSTATSNLRISHYSGHFSSQWIVVLQWVRNTNCVKFNTCHLVSCTWHRINSHLQLGQTIRTHTGHHHKQKH